MASDSYGVLVIGAGNMGAGYDQPGSSEILTHAHAFSTTPGFVLKGFVDTQMEQAHKAASIWGGQAFSDMETALKSTEVDVAVVAVPDEYHFQYLKYLFNARVPFIFLEKPAVRTRLEADQVVNWQKETQVPVLVNYSRRFCPEFTQLREQICNGEWGEYISGTGYYGKGIVHNGSHLIDLLQYLVGEVEQVQGLSRIDDYYPDDPTVTGCLWLRGKRPFFLQGIDCRNYWVFELDLLFTKGRLRLIESAFGWEEYRVETSPVYQSSRDLTQVASYRSTLDMALRNAAIDIREYLKSGRPLVCTLEDSIKDLQICLDLKDDIR